MLDLSERVDDLEMRLADLEKKQNQPEHAMTEPDKKIYRELADRIYHGKISPVNKV